jgi:hypothetical protein
MTSWIPATVSAVAALASLGFAIFVYVSTRRLLVPFERPTLSLLEVRVVTSQADGNVGYALKITNGGKHPATGIRFRTRAAPEVKLQDVTAIGDWSPAHDYEPDGEMDLMIWPPAGPFQTLTMMHVDVSYSDRINGKRYSGEGYWLVIFPGPAGAANGMNHNQRLDAERAWGDQAPKD